MHIVRTKTRESVRDTWATDEKLVAAVERELNINFTLDVCAEKNTAKVKAFYDKGLDGLTEPWFAYNWCNPPFSEKFDWLRKARSEAVENGCCTAFLMSEDSSTEFYQLLQDYSDFILLPTKRSQFYNEHGVKKNGCNFQSVIGWITPWARPENIMLTRRLEV